MDHSPYFRLSLVLDLNELLEVHHTANKINSLCPNPHLFSLPTRPLSHLGGLGSSWLFLIWSTDFLSEKCLLAYPSSPFSVSLATSGPDPVVAYQIGSPRHLQSLAQT